MDTIIIFTDGACSNNGKKCARAGMGVHFPNGELADMSLAFTIVPITNQRAELGAIFLALKYYKKNDLSADNKIIIYTDSNYSIKCLTQYIITWKKNGWKTSNGKEVANQDLIKAIGRYMETYNVQFYHVRSHTGLTDFNSINNAIADHLATSALK